MVEGINAKKVVLSLVMGFFLLLGGFMLFIILSTAYFSYLIYALGDLFSLDGTDFVKTVVSCAFYYLVGFSVWYLGRRKEPSFDKIGRKLLSVSLFMPGIVLFLLIVFSITGTGKSLLALEMWGPVGFGAIAFGLMGFAVYIWRKVRTPKDTAV